MASMNDVVTNRAAIKQFGGLNINNVSGGNEFMDMKDIDSHEYPYLTTRRKNYYFPEDGIYKTSGTTKIPATIQDAIAYDSDIYYIAKYQIRIGQVTTTTYQLEKINTNGVKTECITASDFNTYSARAGETDYDTAERKLVIMGANVIVYPDWLQYNVKDNSFTSMAKKFELKDSNQTVRFVMCDEEGNFYAPTERTDTTPKEAGGHDKLAVLTPTTQDTGEDAHTKGSCKTLGCFYFDGENVGQFYSTNSMWMSTDYYLGIAISTSSFSTTINKNSLKNMGIELNKDLDYIFKFSNILDPDFSDLNGDQTVHRINIVSGDNGHKGEYLIFIIKGINKWAKTYDTAQNYSSYTKFINQENGIKSNIDIKIKTNLYNNLDFIVSEGNRLYACSSEKHEIYASKLGDASIWQQFSGISTDSYAATVGSAGDFTGATVFNNVPMFFKENCIHKINGNTPSSFNISYDYFDGIKKGCSRSISRVGNYLVYYSKRGFVYYTGSQPEKIDDNLSDLIFKNVEAGTKENHYIAQVTDNNDNNYVLDFDMDKGIWYKHKPFNAFLHKLTNISADLYGFIYNTDLIPSIAGIGRNLNSMKNVIDEDDIDYYAESGIIGRDTMEHKYISRLLFKFHLDFGASINIYLKYDYNDEWEMVYCNSNAEDKPSVFTIPIIPKRHEHLRYKIEGTGNVILYGIEYDIAEGSVLK